MILTDEQAQEIADKILRAQDGRTVSAAMRDAIRATERAVLERLRGPTLGMLHAAYLAGQTADPDDNPHLVTRRAMIDAAAKGGRMTTDYNAMTDEQLAVLVAERVMGWDDMVLARERARGWRPAADWADAGRVLEKMWEGGWLWMMEHTDAGRCGYVRAGVGTHARSTADTVPRAICIAALKAVDA